MGKITDVRRIAQRYQVMSLETIMAFTEKTKGQIVARVNMETCSLCGVCTAVCFDKAIEMTNDDLRIDISKCDSCGLCVGHCPLNALTMLNTEKFFNLYMDRERRAST